MHSQEKKNNFLFQKWRTKMFEFDPQRIKNGVIKKVELNP